MFAEPRPSSLTEFLERAPKFSASAFKTWTDNFVGDLKTLVVVFTPIDLASASQATNIDLVRLLPFVLHPFTHEIGSLRRPPSLRRAVFSLPLHLRVPFLSVGGMIFPMVLSWLRGGRE